jgi:FtsZ-interacting cell division protein ZipA
MKPVRAALLLAALGLVGCPKSSSSGDEKTTSKSEDDSKKKSKKSAAAEADDDGDKPAKKKAAADEGDDDADKPAKKKKAAADEGDDDKADKKKPAGDDDKADKKAEPAASNEADVKRYADEKKLDPAVKKKTVAANYTVRVDSVGTAKAVMALPKDTEVTQIAERGSHFLITFTNPKKTTETLMGWIFKAAFEEPKAAGAGSCPAGTKLVDQPATGPFCAKLCASDKACAKGEFCYQGGCMPGSE